MTRSSRRRKPLRPLEHAGNYEAWRASVVRELRHTRQSADEAAGRHAREISGGHDG